MRSNLWQYRTTGISFWSLIAAFALTSCGLVETPLEYEKYRHVVRTVAKLEIDGKPVTIEGLTECVPTSVYKGEPFQGGFGLSLASRPSIFSKRLAGGGAIHMVGPGLCGYYWPDIWLDPEEEKRRPPIDLVPWFQLADSADHPTRIESGFSKTYSTAPYARLKILDMAYSIEPIPPSHGLLEKTRQQDSNMPKYPFGGDQPGRSPTKRILRFELGYLQDVEEIEWKTDPELMAFAKENLDLLQLVPVPDGIARNVEMIISARGWEKNANNAIPMNCKIDTCKPISDRRGYVVHHLATTADRIHFLEYRDQTYSAKYFSHNSFFDPLQKKYISTRQTIRRK